MALSVISTVFEITQSGLFQMLTRTERDELSTQINDLVEEQKQLADSGLPVEEQIALYKAFQARIKLLKARLA